MTNKFLSKCLALINIFFFILLAYIISTGHINRDWWSFITLFLLIIALCFRNKWTWFLGFIICIYGILNFINIGFYSAEPASMQFTSDILMYYQGTIKKVVKLFKDIMSMVQEKHMFLSFFMVKHIQQLNTNL